VLKFLPKTLEFKIISFIGLALLIILTIMTVVNTSSQSKLLIAQEERLAETLSRSILNAIRYPMLSGNQDVVQKIFNYLAQEQEISVLYLTDHEGKIKRSTNKAIIGTKIDHSKLKVKIAANDKNMAQELITKTDNGKKTVYATYLPVKNEEACYACHGNSMPVLGFLGMELDWDKVSRAINTTKFRSILITFLSILIISLLITSLIRNLIIKPINNLIKASEPAAQGDLTKRVEITSNDEIGRLGNAFNSIIINLHDMVSHFRDMASKVSSFAQEISTSSKEMNASTLEISTTIQKISKGVSTQAKRVEDTSRLMEDMSSSVKQVASDSRSASKSSQKSVEQAKGGGAATSEAVEKMNRITETVTDAAAVVKSLGEKSKQIGQITETITSIADQTNLLALNAAIEAARAGEAGRGFAVVAEEVRKLAEGSAEAARRIGTLIKGIQVETPRAVSSIEAGSKEVSEGAKIVSRVSSSLTEIIKAAQQCAAMVDGITKATEQQLQNSEQIVKAVDEVAVVAEESASATQEASSSAQEQTASMQELTASAEELARLALDLQHMVDKFKLFDKKV